MKSEFSYGFAVTHGLLKDKPSIDVAPHFPSLVEEGKVGHDLKLETRTETPILPKSSFS